MSLGRKIQYTVLLVCAVCVVIVVKSVVEQREPLLPHMSRGLLSGYERRYIVDGVHGNQREDGRTRTDYRQFNLDTGASLV